ncbi:uncharacterized protein LOC127813867 [Diospyros lotus]|uniref:uncharacterized protein LOC127813867 n=1 Tax=Diospyros lotus TaxID=55363 RepID=UPI0022501053|nr:uncharacterized protein LOC127813867 [Diospyros lotus]
MADTVTDTYVKPHKLASQIPKDQPNPSKFYTHFLYKAVVVAVFLVVLPLFPSQAPEFINQTLHTRSWELLQLLFVGIAVSYGLFSCRNDETEKDYNTKSDSAQSIVTRFLQASSVFDDEAESPSGSNENKVQTWNSQYFREEPMLVLAEESSVLEEGKPLFLPVRSLKSRVPDAVFAGASVDSSLKVGSLSRSGSNRGSSNSFGGLNSLDLEEKAEDNVVLRSPIPWRSRSGKIDMKEDIDGVSSTEETELNRIESRSIRPQSSRPSKPNSASPSPNKISPSPSLSSPKNPSESPAKNIEDAARKKTYYKSPPPPAPPPPPPPRHVHKPALVKSYSSLSNFEIYPGKELRRSVRSVPSECTRNDREEPLMGKSVRKIRGSEPFGDFLQDNEDEFAETRAAETDEESDVENGRGNEEAASNGAGDGWPPDVNKKADEFIAKFREQIRLQRIESIKRSTGQMARNSVVK